MKTIRSVKLKFSGSSKIKSVTWNYLQAINWLSSIIYESKELNSNRIAREHYATLREKFNLTSQLSCSICKQISATYRSAKSNKRWKKAVFRKITIPLVWKRDFAKTKKNITLWSEPIIISHPWLPVKGWKDSKLKIIKDIAYLILSYEIDIPEPKSTGAVVGVDLGANRIFVARSSNNKTLFFNGGELNHLRKRIRLTRTDVQAVGTRNSRKLLQRLSGKERSVTEHMLHVASKALTQFCNDVGAKTVVFENLNGIRIKSSAKKKRRNSRDKINRWPHAKFLFLATYKLQACGITVKFINPKNTSRGCPKCGYVDEVNRHGLHFKCLSCCHRGDADFVGSVNILQKFVMVEQDSIITGSVNPLKRSGLLISDKVVHKALPGRV